VAEMTARNYPGTSINIVDLNDVGATYKHLVYLYQHWYVSSACTFELALSGSKPDTIASAVLSSFARISTCWYVSPRSYSIDHFSLGTGVTKIYRITKNQ